MSYKMYTLSQNDWKIRNFNIYTSVNSPFFIVISLGAGVLKKEKKNLKLKNI